jgi:hypothetical protein
VEVWTIFALSTSSTRPNLTLKPLEPSASLLDMKDIFLAADSLAMKRLSLLQEIPHAFCGILSQSKLDPLSQSILGML